MSKGLPIVLVFLIYFIFCFNQWNIFIDKNHDEMNTSGT